MTVTDPSMLTDRDIVLLKEQVRERDGGRCTKCGMHRAEHILTYCRDLDVHRIIPGCEYHIDYCITLCKKCHNKEDHHPSAEEQERLLAERNLPAPSKFRQVIVLKKDELDLICRAAEKVGLHPSVFLMKAADRSATKILRDAGIKF